MVRIVLSAFPPEHKVREANLLFPPVDLGSHCFLLPPSVRFHCI